MTWVRMDDGYPRHRKIRPLSDAAFRLDVSGWGWSSEYLTDGHIGADDLPHVADIKKPAAAVAELVKRGRWHGAGHECPRCPEITDGWVIHDYLGYNPSREKVQRERDAKAERQRRWIESRKGQVTNATSNGVMGTSPDASRDASQPASITQPPSPSPSPTTGGARDAPRCPRHQDDPNPPNCGACADARRAWRAPPTPADRPAAEVLGPMPEHDPTAGAAARQALRAQFAGRAREAS